MHEWGDSGITAVLLAIAVVVLVSLVLAHQARIRAARYQKIRRLQFETAEEAQREEAQARAEYKSMLANRNTCAVCLNLASTRCSRCKAVRYCSSKCQKQHWNEGHKQECRAPVSGTSPLSSCNRSRKISDTLSSSVSPNNESTVYFEDVSDTNRFADAARGSLARTVPSSQSNGSIVKPDEVLFPYDIFVKLFNWDKLNVSPCGLINCGNSCFANVVLQCLTYTRPLTAYLLGGSHKRDCRKSDWCFLCELQEHVIRALQHNSKPFSPFEILLQISNIGGSLGVGKQEDAHEFMRYAIDSMQSICLNEAGGCKGMSPRTIETTLIHHIFGGHLESQVTCMNCSHESNRYESMMDLAVEIQGCVETLEDALAKFTATEWLDGENKYKCDRCNAYVTAKKQLTIHVAPNILTIALKRFQSGNFGKLNKRVAFGEQLDISPFMSRKGDKPPLYRLYAVIVHVDMLNASFFGHYICYVKDSEGTWYRIDDNKVEKVDLEKVKAQKAYMLLYTRSSVRHPSLINEDTVLDRVEEILEESRGLEAGTERPEKLENVAQYRRNGITAADGEQGLHAMLNIQQLQSNGGNGMLRGTWETEEMSSSTSSSDIEAASVEAYGGVASDSCLTGSSRQNFPYYNDNGVWLQNPGLECEVQTSDVVELTEQSDRDQVSELPNDFSEVSIQVSSVDAPSTPKQFKRSLDDCLSFSPSSAEPPEANHVSAWPGGGTHVRSLLSSLAPSATVSSNCESEESFCEEEDSVAQAKRQHVENEETILNRSNDMSCVTETEEELKWRDVYWDESKQHVGSPEFSSCPPTGEDGSDEVVQGVSSQEGFCVPNGSHDDDDNDDDNHLTSHRNEGIHGGDASHKNIFVANGNGVQDDACGEVSCSSSDTAGPSPELLASRASKDLVAAADSSESRMTIASSVKSKPLFRRGFLNDA